MLQNLDQIRYHVGDTSILFGMDKLPALQTFDDRVVDYLEHLSKNLLNDTEAKKYPDVITFAFWCRKASVRKLQEPYMNEHHRLGRGVAFHIAPSNVAVNFAYSLVVGMLSGNANIVRIPSKYFEQVRIICTAIQNAMDDTIKPYICLIQYAHDQKITDYLSTICDTRIIWGGDNTIAEIRKSPLKARANEITFADRYSICVIEADEYLKIKNKKEIAQGFYNDTYLSDQNACTSPRLVVWLGKNIDEAQDKFWSELYSIVKEKYMLQPIQAVNKYTNMCKLAANVQNVHHRVTCDNYLTRVEVAELSHNLLGFKGDSGYFIEYKATSLDDILPVCTSQCQTLSYYGINQDLILDLVSNHRPSGIDRIVPIGRTMDFALVWDGYDLIISMSRKITGNGSIR